MYELYDWFWFDCITHRTSVREKEDQVATMLLDFISLRVFALLELSCGGVNLSYFNTYSQVEI